MIKVKESLMTSHRVLYRALLRSNIALHRFYITIKPVYIYQSRFIPEGVAEVSQIFLRDTHVLPKLVSYEKHCGRDRW
jgi:hypothetical protein